jgi:hypothetical protein
MVTTTTFTGSGAVSEGVVQAVAPVSNSSAVKTFRKIDPARVLLAIGEEEINWGIGFP